MTNAEIIAILKTRIAAYIDQGDHEVADMLIESLDKDLVHFTKPVVVTNAEALLSPAGFHPDEGVFIRPGRYIEVDSLDEARRVGPRNRLFQAFTWNKH
jgi:hypothetical protein